MMPYIFIWAGFVLQGTGLTRITNGVIEKFQGSMKRNAPKNQLPHMHINCNFEYVHGRAVHYLRTLSKSKQQQQQNDKRKRKHNEDSIGNYLSSRVFILNLETDILRNVF